MQLILSRQSSPENVAISLVLDNAPPTYTPGRSLRSLKTICTTHGAQRLAGVGKRAPSSPLSNVMAHGTRLRAFHLPTRPVIEERGVNVRNNSPRAA